MKKQEVTQITEHITRYDVSEGRYYTVNNDPTLSPDEKLWSVTNILDKTASKPQLDNYKKKQLMLAVLEEFAPHIPYEATTKEVYSRAKEQRPDYVKFTFDGNIGDAFTRIRNNSDNDRNQKGAWGTLAHDIVADYLKGEDIEIKLQDQDQEVKTSVDNFQNWLANEGKNIIWQPQHIEETHYHPAERYAGTADAIAIEDDEYIVIDWKTGMVSTESKLQIAALANAWNYHNPRAKITRGYVIQIPREQDKQYQIFPVENLEEVYKGFMYACRLFYMKQQLNN